MEMLEFGVKARDHDRYQVAIARKHIHQVTLTQIYT